MKEVLRKIFYSALEHASIGGLCFYNFEILRRGRVQTKSLLSQQNPGITHNLHVHYDDGRANPGNKGNEVLFRCRLHLTNDPLLGTHVEGRKWKEDREKEGMETFPASFTHQIVVSL